MPVISRGGDPTVTYSFARLRGCAGSSYVSIEAAIVISIKSEGYQEGGDIFFYISPLLLLPLPPPPPPSCIFFFFFFFFSNFTFDFLLLLFHVCVSVWEYFQSACGLADSSTCGVTPLPPPCYPPSYPCPLHPIFDIVWEDQRIELLNPAGILFFFLIVLRRLR